MNDILEIHSPKSLFFHTRNSEETVGIKYTVGELQEGDFITFRGPRGTYDPAAAKNYSWNFFDKDIWWSAKTQNGDFRTIQTKVMNGPDADTSVRDGSPGNPQFVGGQYVVARESQTKYFCIRGIDLVPLTFGKHVIENTTIFDAGYYTGWACAVVSGEVNGLPFGSIFQVVADQTNLTINGTTIVVFVKKA